MEYLAVKHHSRRLRVTSKPFELHQEKTNILHMGKTKAQISFAVTAKLISIFVFTTRIIQFLYFLNPKFPVSSHLLCLYSLVCVRPGQNPNCWFSHAQAHIHFSCDDDFEGESCWPAGKLDDRMQADFGFRYEPKQDFLHVRGGKVASNNQGCGNIKAGESMYFYDVSSSKIRN